MLCVHFANYFANDDEFDDEFDESLSLRSTEKVGANRVAIAITVGCAVERSEWWGTFWLNSAANFETNWSRMFAGEHSAPPLSFSLWRRVQSAFEARDFMLVDYEHFRMAVVGGAVLFQQRMGLWRRI